MEKRLVPIAFAGGIDTKTDPKQVLPGKMLDLQNVVFGQTGMLNRRWGYKQLGNGFVGAAGNISAAKAVSVFNQELLLYDGTSAYSYVPANDAWVSRGSAVSVIQTNQQIVAGNNQQLSPDFGTLGGIEVYAWEDSRGGIRYSVVDAASGTIILADQPLYVGMPTNISRPKVIPVSQSNAIAIFFVDPSGHLNYAAVNIGAPLRPPTAVSLLSNLQTPVLYDVMSIGAFVVLASKRATGGGNAEIVLMRLSSLQSVDWTTTFAEIGGAGILTYVALSPTISGGIALAFADIVSPTGVVQLYLLSLATGTTGASYTPIAPFNGTPRSLGMAIAPDPGSTDGKIYLYLEVSPTGFPNTNVIYWQTVLLGVFGFPAASAPVLVRGCGLSSKPFVYNASPYINVAFQSQQQSTYFTLSATGVTIAKALSGLSGGLVQSSDSVLPECPAVTPGVFKYPNLAKTIPNAEAGTVFSLLGVNATKLDFAHSNNFLSESINSELYTVGGVLQRYDGAQYVEQGFHIYPEAIVATPSGAGGSMATGTYFYAWTYESTDNVGATDISTPSIAYSVAVTGPTGSVSHTIPTLRLTKKTGVKIVGYRTTAGGTVLHRITSALVPLYNDPTVDTVVFVDTLADASIIGNGDMYTQPLVTGANPILANSAPPACSLIATFANRLFIAGVDDPNVLQYTQSALLNSPMQFSALLTLRVDPDGGPITALARLDEKLVVFKRSRIFYLTGQGPDANGDNNDFGKLVSIPTGEVGCVSQNTIVSTPVGLIFQSLNGIYLLDRSLNVSYKGAPVEAFNALTITSATLVPNQWVIFTTTTDKSLVYDYFYDQWSTFTNHPGVDAAMYLGGGNQYVYANPNGKVFQQTPTIFTDAGAPIPFRALTAKINPGLLQGYQRVYHAYILGTYKGSHKLQVGCLFDYDDSATALTLIPVDATLGISTFGSDATFGSGSPFGGASSGQTTYQFRLDILRKCQSIQFDITDQESVPGNEGFSLSALTLVLGLKRGGNKVSAVKQFGVT